MEQKVNLFGVASIVIGIVSFFVLGWIGWIGVFVAMVGFISESYEKISPTVALVLNLITGLGWLIMIFTL